MKPAPLDLPPLRLKKQEERRLRAGHLWVYSNEIDTRATPLTGFEAGAPVRIEAHNGDQGLDPAVADGSALAFWAGRALCRLFTGSTRPHGRLLLDASWPDEGPGYYHFRGGDPPPAHRRG